MLRRLLLVLLPLLALLTMLSSFQDGADARATNPWFTFTPKSGGSGTVVTLTGGHFWGNGGVVPIHLVAPRFQVASTKPEDWIEACDWPEPTTPPFSSTPPFATTQSDQDGNWSASIVIPKVLPSGIPTNSTGALCIGAPSAEGWSHPFIVLHGSLPPAGRSPGALGAIAALVSLFFITAGSWLSVRQRVEEARGTHNVL